MTIMAAFPSGPGANTKLALANGVAVLSHSSRTETTGPSMEGRKTTKPANTVRGCGCSLRTKLVTTPKFPPPPRIPQKRSSLAVAFTVRISPDAAIKVTYEGEIVRDTKASALFDPNLNQVVDG